MSEKFLNIHVLMSHSPSCLNRDDMNMQKSAVFGGVRRVRISSQCLKRAIRKSDYYEAHLGKSSDRTLKLGKLKAKYAEALKDRFPEELVSRAIALIAEKEEIKQDTDASAVAPWALSELETYCQKLQSVEETDPKKLKKLFEKESKSFREALQQSVDIALSGRMATSGLMTSIDASFAVAHAITTHATDADIDWFTAADDLSDEEDRGAAHLGTQEFSSGVFYRYASLNIDYLQKNLGDISREKALIYARHLVKMMATIVPTAKQNSFAAHNLADFVMVSFADMPISLANAFEKPVEKKREGFLIPSITALVEYWNKVHKGYGLNERSYAFSLKETKFSPCTETLAELENWVEQDGKGGK